MNKATVRVMIHAVRNNHIKHIYIETEGNKQTVEENDKNTVNELANISQNQVTIEHLAARLNLINGFGAYT